MHARFMDADFWKVMLASAGGFTTASLVDADMVIRIAIGAVTLLYVIHKYLRFLKSKS